MQDVYERHLRPAEKLHQPWMDRISHQRRAGFRALDAELAAHPLATDEARLTLAGITAAIAWRFMQIKLAEPIADGVCPALSAYSRVLEALPAFAQTPPDETVNVSTATRR